MAKHPTVDEIEQAILDMMCKSVVGGGFDTNFHADDLFSGLLDVVQRGNFDLALRRLTRQEAIETNPNLPSSYRLSGGTYEEYFENQNSKNEKSAANGESDPWGPIKVENHEEVAGEIEGFSTAIKAENGLRANHPEETDFVIETADATAKSLRDKEGVITRKRLSTLIDGAYKISKICDATTRIGKVIHAFIEFIRPFL